MSWFVLCAAAGLSALNLLLFTAPTGYEDRDGFHFARSPSAPTTAKVQPATGSRYRPMPDGPWLSAARF